MSWLFGDSLSADNQESPVGRAGEKLQRWTDPLAMIPGGIGTKWMKLTSEKIPDATNRVLEPIAKPMNQFDQTVNPLRKIPMVNNLANLGHAKPGDSIGITIGSIFSGGALGGALGASGAGGTGAAAGAGAAEAGGAGAAGGGGLSSLFGLGGGLGSEVGGGAGAGGLTGAFSGPAAFGDAGLTGTVSSGGSGLAGAMGGDLGGALGSSPTGLFSGLVPGGGMTGTSSGALGGGLSGEVAGSSPIGGASMGGLNLGQYSNLAQQFLQQQSQQRQQQAQQNQNNAQTGFQRLAAPTATLLPFQPARVVPVDSSTPAQQLYAQRLANYGAY